MDVDVVVNLRARRGSPAVAAKCQRELPGARVITSSSLAEAVRFARESALLVSGGGDGTALGLINALRRDLLRLVVLPLGTGNAWAHATGAPSWQRAVERLGTHLVRGSDLPLRRFELVEVTLPGGGPTTISHFAGTGWDAEIIDDFHRQKEGAGVLPRALREGVLGYFHGLFLRTIPRNLSARDLPEVEITNLGDDALGVDERGRPYRLPGGGQGAVLYRGPASVCAAGTSPTWGFGFRAFPFAGLVPGRVCLRVYAGGAGEATLNMGRLWRGQHPMPKMHSWLVDRVRATYSRPVPFQAGGDRLGHRTEVEYGIAREQVDLIDWPRLAPRA
jgi:diacylglycerol kinase family enzyme